MKTVFPSKSEIKRSWFILDASTAPLGRLATQAARILMGKTKPIFTPFLDTGDHVIVINADRAVLTGNKENQKVYRRHSGYPGGLREDKAAEVRAGPPGAHGGRGDPGHAAEDQVGQANVPEAEGVRGRQASARSPAAHNPGRESAVDGAADRTEEQEWL